MLRTLAGVLERRHGAAGAGVEERLRAAVAADRAGPVQVLRAGPLVLACSGLPPARDGDAVCVLDGILDAPVSCGPDEAAAAAERSVLDAWRRDGDTALNALRGDAALVLWDGRRGALARDHLGLRGLVHHDDGTLLRFASDVHVLLALLPATPGADPHGLAHWLAGQGLPGEHTLVEGVRTVPAAGVVELDPGGPATPRRHWTPRYRRPADVGLQEAAGLLGDALATAVARRSTGPDGTGLLLSGGLDSGAVAGVACAAGPASPRRAYCAVFPRHPSIDEAPLIGRVAAHLGLDCTAAEVHRAEVLAPLAGYVQRFRLPPSSPNLFFWNPLLGAAAADGTPVLLDGEGGDELLGGSPYLISDHLRAGRVRAAAAVVRALPGADRGLSRREVLRWLRDPGLTGAAPAVAHAVSGRRRRDRARPVPWLGPALAAAFDETAPGGAWKRLDGPRWWASLVHAATRTAPALAHEHQRRRAAAAGLVARHPLLDVDVVELVLGLPPQLALDPRHSRPLLREAVRGLLPDEVRLRRTKSTFDDLWRATLAGPQLPAARSLLGPGALVLEHVDAAAVGRLVARPPEPRERGRWALEVWRLLGAECFLRGLEDRAAPVRAVGPLAGPPADVRVGPLAVSTR